MKNTEHPTDIATKATQIRNLRNGQRFDYAGERVEVVSVGRYERTTGTCIVMTADHGWLWINANRMVRTYRRAVAR